MMFKTYVIRNYLSEDSPKGDFARDTKDVSDFPKNGQGKFKGWHDLIERYLLNKGACIEAMEVFEEMWAEYEERERKRLGYIPRKEVSP